MSHTDHDVSSEQKIRVQSETLINVVAAVSKGQYRIPQFQREFVWEKSKVIELFDSIYKEYPIGSFFLWKADRIHNRLFRHSISLNIPPVKDDDDVSFILDGQQRITSLYVTLVGLTAEGTDYSRVCFDAKDQKFTYREPDNKRFVSIHDIWGRRALEIVEELEKEYKPAYRHCFEVLRTYPVSIVVVADKDLPAVCKIFQRINQSGKRLDRFDLISSMTFSTDFDLREKYRQDILAPLKQNAFGEVPPAIVTQLMALLKKGACTERAEYSLTAEEIKELWQSVIDGILLAADTLRKNFGVKSHQYLPYDAILTLLAYFFAKYRNRSLTREQLEWVSRWFWRASFSQHYGSGGPTKMGRDAELFDDLQQGEQPLFKPSMSLTTETLIGTKMTWSGSAIRNAFLCLLAQRGPVHLVNNGPLDLVNGSISDFTSAEKHHIFPQAFLRRSGVASGEVHDLPNFCFLPAELNKRINDTQPSLYFPELKRENARLSEALDTHLIPLGENSGLQDDNYLQFLKSRGEMILLEIERLAGLSVAPPASQRQNAIKSIETRLRDLIHRILLDTHGPKYWEKIVPEDIRNEAEKRINTELRKQRELRPEQFCDPRKKLDYCNVPDYSKLILNNSNWPHFEPVFVRRIDVERHLEGFSDFRNSLMHNRELTEISRKAGELAIVWLETTLPGAAGQEAIEEDSEEHE
jgi:hypothetical protein